MPSPFRALAESIAGADAPEAKKRFTEVVTARGLTASEEAADLASLLTCAYPALARSIDAFPEDVVAVARGMKQARDPRAYKRVALGLIGDMTDHAAVRRGLRVFARRERLRVAARELLPHAGSDIDVTSRELSDLANVCIELALAEALGWADARFGVPLTGTDSASAQRAARPGAQARCKFVVLGMGKLGGHELNVGSSRVDLQACKLEYSIVSPK